MSIDIIEKLISFEDKYSEELMTWEYKGINFWPCIRTPVFMGIEQKFEGSINRNLGGYSTFDKISLWYKIFRNSMKLPKNPYFYMPDMKIVYVNSAITRVLEVNGKKFDRISDFFAIENQHISLTMEDNYLGRHNPPEYISNIKYTDSIFLYSKLKNLFIKDRNLHNNAKGFISLVKQYITSNLEKSVDLEHIFSNAFSTIITSIKIAAEMYKLIKKTGCKLVSIEECCYGGYRSLLAMMLKADGIKVFEIQHGNSSNKHIAYNYGVTPITYLKYLPDYFFTHGQYWSDVLERLPVNKLVIGNPYLAEQVRTYNKSNEQQTEKKRILIVSSTTDSFVAVIKELRVLLPLEYHITFRLHPIEIQFRAERYSELENVPGIEINENDGIFDCIRTHDYVVGEHSTTLFEAIPFGKKIFILDTYYSKAHMPKNMGIWFSEAKDLADFILKDCKNEDFAPSYYWTLDWQEKFNNFINIHL